MREEVETLRQSGRITEEEHTVLVAALVWGTSWCSNTSGVFKGFHRGWGGATKTAWYRIKETLEIRPPILLNNGQKNLVFQQDAQTLASQSSVTLPISTRPTTSISMALTTIC